MFIPKFFVSPEGWHKIYDDNSEVVTFNNLDDCIIYCKFTMRVRDEYSDYRIETEDGEVVFS